MNISSFWAVISALLVGMLPFHTAQAVQLNPDGVGEVLIFPYYTAQVSDEGEAYNSLLSLTNATGNGKAVKIRIRERKFGDEVASFNLLMAPYDMWTAALVPDGKNLKVVTQDTSCLKPAVGAGGPVLSLPEVTDGSVIYGYIEVLEMGAIKMGSETAKGSMHVQGSDGTWAPPSCSKAFMGAKEDTAYQGSAGVGGLSGNLTLINVQAGFSFTTKAVALKHFAKSGTVLGYTEPGDSLPDLTSAEPVSNVPGEGEDEQLISHWPVGTADAVSVVLMRQSIVNDYVTAAETASRTDWVATFPTKPYYYEKTWTDTESNRTRAVLGKLFQRTLSASGGCDDFSAWVYGREDERSYSGGMGLPPPGLSTALCYTSNVISFKSPTSPSRGRVFPNTNTTLTSVYDNGYARISFSEASAAAPLAPNTYQSWTAHQLTSDKTTVMQRDGAVLKDQTRRYIGLPMVGFAAITYTNAGIALPDGKVGRSIYGVAVPHSFTTDIK